MNCYRRDAGAWKMKPTQENLLETLLLIAKDDNSLLVSPAASDEIQRSEGLIHWESIAPVSPQ